MLSIVFTIVIGSVLMALGINGYNRVKRWILRKPTGFHLNLLEFFLVPVAALYVTYRIWGMIVGIQDFSRVERAGTILWAIERVTIGSSPNAGETWAQCYVHALDLRDGAKLYRKDMPGNFSRVALSGNMAWCWNDDALIGVDVPTGTEVYEVTASRLEKSTGAGVSGFGMEADGIVRVQTKTGDSLLVDPVTLTVLPRRQLSNPKEPAYLPSAVDLKLLGDQTRVRHRDPISGSIIVESADPSDEHEFIITCLDPDGKRRWQKTQTELGVRRFFLKRSGLTHSLIADGALIVTSGNFIVSLDMATGNLRWKSAL